MKGPAPTQLWRDCYSNDVGLDAAVAEVLARRHWESDPYRVFTGLAQIIESCDRYLVDEGFARPQRSSETTSVVYRDTFVPGAQIGGRRSRTPLRVADAYFVASPVLGYRARRGYEADGSVRGIRDRDKQA